MHWANIDIDDEHQIFAFHATILCIDGRGID
jgi:hypothetical protein